MLLLIILGAVLASTTHYHELLGTGIQQAGGGMILTGMLYSPAAVLGIYSGRTQNKFLLLLVSPPRASRLGKSTHSLCTCSSSCCFCC